MDGNNIYEYSGLPSTQSYETKPQTQTEGAGVGGESIKENFIDSVSNEYIKSDGDGDYTQTSGSWDDNRVHTEGDFMYNWIRKHSGK